MGSSLWAAASGNFNWGNPEAKETLCMFMSGPLLTGYTQTSNDWYDKEIDTINEPNQPIPSGAIPKKDALFGTLTLDVIVLTLLCSTAEICEIQKMRKVADCRKGSNKGNLA